MPSVIAIRGSYLLPPRLLASPKPSKLPNRFQQPFSFLANHGNKLNKKVLHEEHYVNLKQVAESNGVRLTHAEIQSLRHKLGSQCSSSNHNEVSLHEFREASRRALDAQWGREFSLSAMEKPNTFWDHVGAKLLFALDIGGKTLFAVVGTQLAGEAGMNIVGCTLVGCISCLGGGTLNTLLYGVSPYGKPGVIWVHNPTVFYFALAASVFTFFTWPIYCRMEARRELKAEFGGLLEDDLSVSKKNFVHAMKRKPEFKSRIKAAVAKHADPKLDLDDPRVLFDLVDDDHSGFIDLSEMQALVQHRFNASSTMYTLDTLALSALSVTAVHMAITRGLTPIVAATSGITICFGGILRDVLCGRHLALGGQSYALATGAGSTVYILLRELSIRSTAIHIPLVARIFLSAGTTMAVRVAEYLKGEPLLKPMHHHDDVSEKLEQESETLLNDVQHQLVRFTTQSEYQGAESLVTDTKMKQGQLVRFSTVSEYQGAEKLLADSKTKKEQLVRFPSQGTTQYQGAESQHANSNTKQEQPAPAWGMLSSSPKR